MLGLYILTTIFLLFIIISACSNLNKKFTFFTFLMVLIWPLLLLSFFIIVFSFTIAYLVCKIINSFENILSK